MSEFAEALENYLPAPAKPFALRICTFIKNRFSDIIKMTKSIWSKIWKRTTKKDY